MADCMACKDEIVCYQDFYRKSLQATMVNLFSFARIRGRHIITWTKDMWSLLEASEKDFSS